MDIPIQQYMKIGIVHFVTYPCLNGDGPILDTINKICADPYFEAIEISWIHDDLTKSKVKEMLLTSGMNVVYCAHPWLLVNHLDLNSADQEQRDAAVSAVLHAIDDAAGYGLENVALLSGAYPGLTGRAAAMDLLEDSLIQICDYAKLHQINIIMEVFDQEIDKKRLIGKTSDALEIAERVCMVCDNFGLLVDLSHLPLLNETPREALEPVKKFLKHVHIGNCYMGNRDHPAWGDSHPRFGYPGSEVDVDEITEFLRVLLDIGYLDKDLKVRPIVSFEIKPMAHEDPDLIIANSKRKLNEAWAKL